MDILVARAYSVSLFSVCMPWFLLRDTRDATVHITLMMSFAVVSTDFFYVIAEIYIALVHLLYHCVLYNPIILK